MDEVLQTIYIFYIYTHIHIYYVDFLGECLFFIWVYLDRIYSSPSSQLKILGSATVWDLLKNHETRLHICFRFSFCTSWPFLVLGTCKSGDLFMELCWTPRDFSIEDDWLTLKNSFISLTFWLKKCFFHKI